MKNISILGIAALMLGFAACDDVEESLSKPQTNPQLAIANVGSVTFTPGSAMSATVNLEDLNANDQPVNVASLSPAQDWPTAYTPVVAYMELSEHSNFANSVKVETTTDYNGNVFVAADAWEEAHQQIYGKSPATTKTHARFVINAVNGTEKVTLGIDGKPYYYGVSEIEVKPFDMFSGQVIQDAYYLLSSTSGYDLSKAVKLTPRNNRVYDDPVFAAAIDVESSGLQWIIVPESTIISGSLSTAEGSQFGVVSSGSTALNGALSPNAAGQGANPGTIAPVGTFMMEVNMYDYEYSIKTVVEKLYTPGNSNGWNQGASMVLTTNNYQEYFGYVYLNGEWKLSTLPNWDGTNYGDGGNGMLSTDGGAGNLQCPSDGLYWVTANLFTLKYTMMKVNTIGVIGGATPNGWTSATALTPSADLLTWSGVVTLGEGIFKFIANDNMSVNLGGKFSNLYQEGGDLTSPGAGNYLITLNLATVPYSCTVVKQ